MPVRRRDYSWKVRGSMSYGFSRDRVEDTNYESYSGTVATSWGLVCIGASRWIDDRHEPSRHFTMVYRGRMFARTEDAPIFSTKHGAYLAGKFARDVASGRVR